MKRRTMKSLHREAITILGVILLMCNVSNAASSTSKLSRSISADSVEDLDYYYYDSDETLDSKLNTHKGDIKACPRDCMCSGLPETRVAKCSRLELGTQIFGEEVTGLEVTSLGKLHPLILTDMIFHKMGLHRLTNMKLTNNIMIMLESTAFGGLDNLLSVNISNNRITDIDLNIFESNRNLALVDLSDNPLSISKYDKPILNSTSIQELEIARCGLTKVNRKTFSLLPNIIYINLAGNKLLEIDPLLFINLIALEELDLSDNFIEKIPDNLLTNNPNITTLTLRGNPLKSVVGVQIKELLTIDLSLTNIRAIGPSMFSGMVYLSNVNLSGSGISKIHNQAFHNLTLLNYLDLSDNDLDMVSDQLIKTNLDLDIFKIARNPLLTQLPKDGFACANSTFNTYLFDASGCNIEILHDNTFRTMSTLSQLLLSNNQITDVGKSLYYCPKLRKIDLSYNLITTLDKYTFSRNIELGKLNLAGNPLKVLSPELFIDNPNIAWLDVSSCELTHLWTLSSDVLPAAMNNLHFINASYNDIKSITNKELEIASVLMTLDISQNPLECNLDFEVLMTWVEKHYITLGSFDMMYNDGNPESVAHSRKRWNALAKSVCKQEKPSPVIVVDKNKLNNKDKEFQYVDDYEDDQYNGSDYGDDDDDAEDIYDDSFMKNKKNKEKATDIINNADKVLKDKQSEKDDKHSMSNNDENADELIELVSKINENIDTDKISIPYGDDIIKNSEKAEEELINAFIERKTAYLDIATPLRIVGILLGCILLILAILKLVKYCVTHENNSVKCAIINLRPSSGDRRGKKDCGLVYQQLTEDLTGPKTPIISRHLLGMSDKNKLSIYQDPPFIHKKIIPEHV